jgi:putative endonuclease
MDVDLPDARRKPAERRKADLAERTSSEARGLPAFRKPERHREFGVISAYRKGIVAEEVAANLLREKGFAILATRFRSQSGEVDLVAASQNRLAFVEVKRRRSRAEGAYAITDAQQRRIAGAAELWLQAHPDYFDRDITFDAILISPGNPPYHMEDAFRL